MDHSLLLVATSNCIGVVVCFGLVTAVYCFSRRQRNSPPDTRTIRALHAYRDTTFMPLVVVHIDVITAPGLLTPTDGTPLYRARVNGRPWMEEDKGLEGVGYLFETEKEATTAVLAGLAAMGFMKTSPLIELL